jgi:hypothetical protein
MPAVRRSLAERRTVMLFAVVALLLSLACGEPFLHTNPYDPAVPITVTLDGPDTLFSSFEQAFYTAHADPPVFPDTAFFYQSSSPLILQAAPGSFTVLATPLYPDAFGVEVAVGLGAIDTAKGVIAFRHSVTRTIYLSQRIRQIKLRCPDTHVCDPMPVGATWSVWVDPTDSLGHEIQAYFSSVSNAATGTPLVIYSVRDSTIASVVPLGTRVGTVTALKTGTTWILGTRGPLVDSMQLVVH